MTLYKMVKTNDGKGVSERKHGGVMAVMIGSVAWEGLARNHSLHKSTVNWISFQLAKKLMTKHFSVIAHTFFVLNFLMCFSSFHTMAIYSYWSGWLLLLLMLLLMLLLSSHNFCWEKLNGKRKKVPKWSCSSVCTLSTIYVVCVCVCFVLIYSHILYLL